MIYIIYDFAGLKMTKKKYQQYFKTLLFTAKECESHSDGNKLFKILQPTGRDLWVDLDKKERVTVTARHSNKQESIDEDVKYVDDIPNKMEFLHVHTTFNTDVKGDRMWRNYDKCIVCTMEEDSPYISQKYREYIIYSVKDDRAAVLLSGNVVDNVVLSYILYPRLPLEAHYPTHNRFIMFNPQIGWVLNSDFWMNEFHRSSGDNYDIFVGALRLSMGGLFYDKLGDNADTVISSPTIERARDMLIWSSLENDICQHFRYITNFSSKVKEEVEEERGHCGYLDPKWPGQTKLSNSSHELLRKCGPQKDPCAPPKWLIQHLYVNSVENDGEIPDKKKLHDLLDYMVDYVASWTECDNAHSAQQMKDILPLLVRCKIILEGEREKTE